VRGPVDFEASPVCLQSATVLRSSSVNKKRGPVRHGQARAWATSKLHRVGNPPWVNAVRCLASTRCRAQGQRSSRYCVQVAHGASHVGAAHGAEHVASQQGSTGTCRQTTRGTHLQVFTHTVRGTQFTRQTYFVSQTVRGTQYGTLRWQVCFTRWHVVYGTHLERVSQLHDTVQYGICLV